MFLISGVAIGWSRDSKNHRSVISLDIKRAVYPQNNGLRDWNSDKLFVSFNYISSFELLFFRNHFSANEMSFAVQRKHSVINPFTCLAIKYVFASLKWFVLLFVSHLLIWMQTQIKTNSWLSLHLFSAFAITFRILEIETHCDHKCDTHWSDIPLSVPSMAERSSKRTAFVATIATFI